MLKRIWMLVLLAASCFGQSVPATLTVYLNVESQDIFLKNRIESILSRELRKLGDVAVIGDAKKPMTFLHALAVNTVTTQGQELGYAFSVVGTLRNAAPPGGELYMRNWLFTGNSSGKYIEGDCISAVASFDREVLEPLRESFRSIAKGQ